MWVMFSTNVLLDGLTACGWGWCQSLEGTFGNPHPNCSPPWAELSQDFHRTQPESLVQDSGLQELILDNLSSPLSHLTFTTSNCTESAAHTGQFLASGPLHILCSLPAMPSYPHLPQLENYPGLGPYSDIPSSGKPSLIPQLG